MAWNAGRAPPNVPPRRRGSESINLSYYHPNLKTMEEVREMLVPFLHVNGYFLVRNSFSKRDTLTVSVMHERSIKHFSVGRNPSGFFLQDKLFATLDQLIRHHAADDVPNVEGVHNVRLLVPVAFEGGVERPHSLSGLPSSGNVSPQVQRSQPFTGRIPVEHTESYQSGNSLPVSSRTFSGDPSLSPASLLSHDPPLPQSPSTLKKEKAVKSGVFTKIFKKEKSRDSSGSGGSGSSVTNLRRPSLPGSPGSPSTMARRPSLPPAPIPPVDPAGKRVSADSVLHRPQPEIPRDRSISESESSNPIYDKSLYCRVENRADRAPSLIANLRKNDTNTTKCECGLELHETELPRGWSIHISHEENTKGRVFFEGPRGQTAWNLPLDVSLELSMEQQDFMRRLLHDVRAGKLPPPQPHGETAAEDTTGDNRSAGAFNNSLSGSSGESGAVGRGAGAGGPMMREPGQRGSGSGGSRSGSGGSGIGAADQTGEQNSNIPDRYLSQSKSESSGEGGTWC